MFITLAIMMMFRAERSFPVILSIRDITGSHSALITVPIARLLNFVTPSENSDPKSSRRKFGNRIMNRNAGLEISKLR